MSRRTPVRKNSRKKAATTRQPDAAPKQADAEVQPVAEPTGPEATTTIHGVPGAAEPVTVTGDKALPGIENLTFRELAQLAGMAGIETPPGTEEAIDGVIMADEAVAARQLLPTPKPRARSRWTWPTPSRTWTACTRRSAGNSSAPAPGPSRSSPPSSWCTARSRWT